MKVIEDFIYALKKDNGFVCMYIDEQCHQPYVNSAIYDTVCMAMESVQPGIIEMVMLNKK